MYHAPFWELLAIFGLCSVSALMAFKILRRQSGEDHLNHLKHVFSRDPIFVFGDNTLLDANSYAKSLLDTSNPEEVWPELVKLLKDRFPRFPANQTELEARSPLLLSSAKSGEFSEVFAESVDGISRIHIRAMHDDAGSDYHSTQVLNWKTIAESAPYPIWKQNTVGDIIWKNKSYDILENSVFGKEGQAPAASLFPDFHSNGLARKEPVRVKRPDGDGSNDLWYEVTSIRKDEETLHYATDVNAVVRAESAQRNFVQTLAKTFAQLSIGLVIFNRSGQLVLFNPALMDLTGLPVDFLSARPNILSFFDRLRDRRIMPEPKDYKDWRDQMALLVAEATDGCYQDTWTLPSGSIYRVTGRPHPDSAIAFLFEDITAEVTLTRRFRTEIAAAQNILDHMPDALAVFSQSGTLTMYNSAYTKLWAVDPSNSFAEFTISDATSQWQAMCCPTPLWGELRDFVVQLEKREKWTDTVKLQKNGTLMECQIDPLPDGSTLIQFRQFGAQSFKDDDLEIIFFVHAIDSICRLRRLGLHAMVAVWAPRL